MKGALRSTRHRDVHSGPSLAVAIVSVPVAQLKAFPSNPRLHSDKQIRQLMRNIKDVGFTSPILIDEFATILSGHGRWEAAKRLRMAAIPTLTYSGCSDAQKRAIVLAENRLAELSSWDTALLKQQLEALIDLDFEVELTGFSTSQVDMIIDGPAAPELKDPQDDLPPFPLHSISRAGDLWVLGDHKLRCGDARDSAVYRDVLGADTVRMTLTDPPYNVRIHGHARGQGKIRHREFAMASGEMSNSKYHDFLRQVMSLVHSVCADGSLHYWFIDWRHLQTLLSCGGYVFDELKQLLVWNKINAGLGSFYRSQHELITVFKKGDHPHINNFGLGATGRYRTNVIDFPGMTVSTARNRKERDLHPTVKPVGLLADLIRDSSQRGDVILDPFCGSGSTLLAAERTGRQGRAIEIDPIYADVAITRWQEMAGKAAVLAATGQCFTQVSKDRLAND